MSQRMDAPDLTPEQRLLDNISKCVLHFRGEGALAYINKYHNAVVEACAKKVCTWCRYEWKFADDTPTQHLNPDGVYLACNAQAIIALKVGENEP